MKTPEKLTTERLIIRHFTPEDFADFQRFMLDKEATQYLNFTDEQLSSENIRALFDGTIAGYNSENTDCILAIAEARTNQYIGLLGGHPLEVQGEFEIFYNLLPEVWGNGYAVEAVTAFLEFLKNETDFQTAVAFIHIENEASVKLAHRLNMTNEGTLMHDGHQSFRYTYPLS